MRLFRLMSVLGLAVAGLVVVAMPAQAVPGPWLRGSDGAFHTCGITTAKSLYCWGYNTSGQTGDGTVNTPRLSAHRVGAAGVWTSVDAGSAHTCGITTAKSLYCWGNNGAGQTGDGTINHPRLSLHRVGAAGVWTTVAAGRLHTCGITTAKNLYCWGYNGYGQTGDGTANTPRLTLHRVGAAGVWRSVAAGDTHTCGITSAKNLYCWGNNGFGQTGDGTTTSPRLSLHRVGAAGVWTSVSAGDFHTCGITAAKSLYCWGNNFNGQTGDGTVNTPRLSLHRVGAAGVWTRVDAGAGHTCGITSAKSLYCWGYNGFGQTGDGTTTNPRLSLHRVGAAGVWTRVDAGGGHTCGITTAKNLYCWGHNQFGQTGDDPNDHPHLTLHKVT